MRLQNEATKILEWYINDSIKNYLGLSEEIDNWILHKIRHTYWVWQEWQNIYLNDDYLKSLDQKIIDLCEVSAILHDVARFYQIDKNKKEILYWDSVFEHWNVWFEMLKKTFFKDFPEVLLAVKYHNKRSHNDLYKDDLYIQLSDEQKKVSDICLKYVRDADKIQNIKTFFVNVDYFLLLDSKYYSKEPTINPVLLNQFLWWQTLDKKLIKTLAESILIYASWINDLNFDWSKKIIKYIDFNNELYKIFVNKLGVSPDLVRKLID